MSQESTTVYSSDDSSDAADECRVFTTTNVPDNNNTASPKGLAESVESITKNAVFAAKRLRIIGDDAEKIFRVGLDTGLSLPCRHLDDATAQELEACFNEISLFIEAETKGLLYEYDDPNFLDCITHLFDANFLSILLVIRNQLLQTASSRGLHRPGEMVACSVDRIFARFWDCVSSIAGSRQISRKLDNELPVISNHKEENNLRVASQLPRTWQQCPELLRSGHASPASKRMVLCLLFASLVMKSDLDNCVPWRGAGFRPGQIIECLQPLLEEYATQARTLDLSGNSLVSVHLRTTYAMAIALYSSAEVARRSHEDAHLAPFQPHTMTCLLELMQYIFPPRSEALVALDDLDDAQTVLLHWGNTIPWAWEKCDDPRIIGFGTVISTTSNWLCHFDKSLIMTLGDNVTAWEGSDAFPSSHGVLVFLKAVLKINPRSSLVAFFHQICDENNREIIPENTLNCERLHRSLWCLAELIQNCSGILSSTDISLVAEQLVSFFAEVGENSSNAATKVRNEVIRGLKALSPERAEKVLLSFQKNVPFFSKIAGTIAKASRMITEDATGCFLLDPGVSEGIGALLDFISLFYKHSASRCIPVTTFQLLSDLVHFLSKRVGTLALRTALLGCLSHAHVIQCQTIRPGRDPLNVRPESNERSPAMKVHKTWDDEEAYHLALDVNCGDLGLAVAFASYISLTVKKATNALLVTEAWDYLRDILLLLVTGQLQVNPGQPFGHVTLESGETFVESTTPTGAADVANIIEKICTALEAVLKRCDTFVVRLLLESPLTNSLHVSLESLAKAAKGGNLDGNTGTNGADGIRSTRAEELNKFDLRTVRTCERFSEKLKKAEADLNKSS